MPRRAALIVRGMDRYTLFNLSDSPKVQINGKPVANKEHLGDHDLIEVFGLKLRFKVDERA